MKNIAKKSALLLILGTSALTAMEATKCELPYIILHMDINKTLIAESTGKGFGPETGLAALLSTAPEYAYTWGDGLEKMTYNKWVDEKLFPGSDPTLKSKRESYHAGFVEAARNANHPMSQEITDEFNALIDALKTQYPRKVFTSFSNLITYLKEKNYSFSVILRTFGKDLDGTAKELAQDGLNNFIYGSFHKGALNLNNKVLSDPAEIIASFEPAKHYAIQDSYDWWKQNNFTEKGGKPFPIDISDKRILSIFFDDNANDPVKPILNIIPIGKKTNLNELITIGRVVPVDTRKAILDKNYFINAVEKALKKWQEMFCQQETFYSQQEMGQQEQ